MASTYRLIPLLAAIGCAACGNTPETTGPNSTVVVSTNDAGVDQPPASSARYPFDIGNMRWANLPTGDEQPPATLFDGKVVLVKCFQAWCPGCRSHGIPLMKEILTLYGSNPDFVGMFLHTVFEGSHVNTFDNGLATLESYHKIDKPLYAHHPGNGGAPKFMKDYQVGATPWFVLFGKDGKVITSTLGIDNAKQWPTLIDQALAAEGDN
jgi:thiol-disulfide isomerase/thioredoxin